MEQIFVALVRLLIHSLSLEIVHSFKLHKCIMRLSGEGGRECKGQGEGSDGWLMPEPGLEQGPGVWP